MTLLNHQNPLNHNNSRISVSWKCRGAIQASSSRNCRRQEKQCVMTLSLVLSISYLHTCASMRMYANASCTCARNHAPTHKRASARAHTHTHTHCVLTHARYALYFSSRFKSTRVNMQLCKHKTHTLQPTETEACPAIPVKRVLLIQKAPKAFHFSMVSGSR